MSVAYRVRAQVAPGRLRVAGRGTSPSLQASAYASSILHPAPPAPSEAGVSDAGVLQPVQPTVSEGVAHKALLATEKPTFLPGSHVLPLPARAHAAVQALAPVHVLYFGMALGYCTDLLFYNQALGISVPIFAALLLGALFVFSRRQGVTLAFRNAAMLVPPILFFATMVFVRANPTLTAMNLGALFVLFLLLAFFYGKGHLERLGLLGYFVTLARSFAAALVYPAPVVSYVARDAAAHKHRFRLAGPLLRGVLIAIPVLLVFTALLYSADSIFAGVIDNALKLDFFTNGPELAWRLVLVLVAAWFVSGFLLLAVRRSGAGTAPGGTAHAGQPAPTTPLSLDTPLQAPRMHLGFTEGVVVLTLVNALFLVFGYIQVVYLFSGQALRSLNYEAYREYVRSGFGQLLVAAVLAMVLIVGLRHFVWKETGRETRTLNLLGSLMIGLTLVMLVSAFWRMLVWENVAFYINTQTRIYVRWFIIWLGIAFLWLLGIIWLRPNRFAIGAFAAAIGFLVSVNLANPDADVAARNLARKDELSVRYLYLLSEDSVPVLAQGLDQTSGEIHTAISAYLAGRLSQFEDTPSLQSWQSFNLSRARSYELLKELRSKGKLY